VNRNRLWVLLFVIVAVGCHRHPKNVATPSLVPPVAASAPLSPSLVEAESAFRRGDFLSSAIAFESFFESGSTSNEMDRLRFHFGVAQSLSGIASLEAASTDTFKDLIREYPESAFAPPAKMALSLKDDIVRLQADKVSQEGKIRELAALVPPAPPILPLALAEAESAWEAADYATAAKAYEVYLQSKPKTADMDRILLRFGVSQALSGVLAREKASNDTFNQLIKEYPKSPYALSAGRVIAMQAERQRLQKVDQTAKDEEIQKLKDELNNIKKVDSQRRRNP